MAEMTTYERVVQIYQVLIAAAHQRQTLTYQQLGEHVGLPAWGFGPHLEHIWQYCNQHPLPPLTVLVVHKGEGTPGVGFTTADSANRDRERVYEHNWFRMKPLAVEMLKQQTLATESKARETTPQTL